MIARHNRTTLSFVAMLLACAASLAVACGPEADKTEKKVRISVVVILASDSNAKVDKKLEHIAKEVQKMYPKLTHFEMAKLSCKSVSVGKLDKFDLVEDEAMNITVQKVTMQKLGDKVDRIELKVNPPMMGEITYSTPCGKFLPIMTPYRTKTGQVVIVAVRVQPCGGK